MFRILDNTVEYKSLKKLRRVFKRTEEFGLQFNSGKYKILNRKIAYLGFVV